MSSHYIHIHLHPIRATTLSARIPHLDLESHDEGARCGVRRVSTASVAPGGKNDDARIRNGGGGKEIGVVPRVVWFVDSKRTRQKTVAQSA